jgi:hypothetical protein
VGSDMRASMRCEYSIFSDSVRSDWRDDRPQLWGLLRDLVVIGTARERLAKFPEPSNVVDPWHGYPVSALDPKREFEHRPHPSLVKRWRDAALINDAQAARINRGKV